MENENQEMELKQDLNCLNKLARLTMISNTDLEMIWTNALSS